MADSFIGEIQITAANYAPAGWAFCAGQLLQIAEYDALFSLIGTTYGGDGQSTFALPDLRGRIPIHQGSGYVMGQAAGVEQVTVTNATMPSHTHSYNGSTDGGTAPTPIGNVAASSNTVKIYKTGVPAQAMNAGSLAPTGGSQPHNNCQPFIVLNYIISLFGIYPSPN
jgi:microcystin-dependent protein